jgi:hypothetical protein
VALPPLPPVPKQRATLHSRDIFRFLVAWSVYSFFLNSSSELFQLQACQQVKGASMVYLLRRALSALSTYNNGLFVRQGQYVLQGLVLSVVCVKIDLFVVPSSLFPII